jgi:hypothetical protein
MFSFLILLVSLALGVYLFALEIYYRQEEKARDDIKTWLRQQVERDQLIYLLDLYRERQRLQS